MTRTRLALIAQCASIFLIFEEGPPHLVWAAGDVGMQALPAHELFLLTWHLMIKLMDLMSSQVLRSMKIHGAIFDLDGTLGDTLPVCYQAFRYVFQEYEGKSYSDQEIASMFGPSEKGIFQKRVPDQWEPAWKTYLERYSSLHTQYGKRFPGIDHALDLLKENKIPLGIVTGKGKESAEISLEHLGLAAYFDVIEAGHDERGVKPEAIRRILKAWNLPGENVIYVGDLTYDIRSAREAGVIPLAAAWSNTLSREELSSEKPYAIFSTVDEFVSWLIIELGQI